METTKRRSKMLLLGMTAMVLSFGLVLSGCETTGKLFPAFASGVETAISKQIYDDAVELVLSRDEGILVNVFETALKKKYVGLKTDTYNASVFAFTYKDRKYRLNMQSMTGADKYFRYTGVTSCLDITPEKK